MGMDAGVTYTFLDKDGNVILKDYLDCYKNRKANDGFDIPEGSTYFKIKYRTEYHTDTEEEEGESETEYLDDTTEEEEEGEPPKKQRKEESCKNEHF